MEAVKRKRKRVDWIDSAKGIAILLVVIGHVGGGYTGRYSIPEYQQWIDYLVWFVYTFHMPLFFCLSGYVYRIANNKVVDSAGYKSLVRKKAVKLMIPYYVFSTLQILIKLPLQGKISTVLSWKNILLLPIHAVDQYWFIYTLFICYVLLAYLEWKRMDLKKVVGIALGFWFVSQFMNDYLPESVLWYLHIPVHFGASFVFFCFGAMLCDLKYRVTALQAAGCGVVFLLLQWVIYFGGINLGIWLPFLRFCLAITAILGVLYIASIGPVKRAKWLQYIGENSMSIYVVHVVLCAAIRILLYAAGIDNFAVHLILGTLLSIVIPLLLQQVFNTLRFKIRKG